MNIKCIYLQFVALLYLAFILSSCASPDNFHIPDISSIDIDNHKSLVVHANNDNILDSGVLVKEGSFYSILVSGEVSLSDLVINQGRKNFNVTPEYRLGVMIGEDSQIIPPVNSTMKAQNTGNIRVFFVDNKHYDNIGYFNVTIIVWKTKDLVSISSHLKKIELLNPEKEEIKGIADQTIILKEYYSKLYQNSNNTKVNIPIIKKEQSKTNITDIRQEVPIQPSQFETNKGPDSDVSDSNSPMMLIVSPQDGQTISSVAIQLIGVIEDDNGLQKVEIFINGKPLLLDQGRGIRVDHVEAIKRYEFNESVAVNSGKNLIKIVAEDVSGRVTEQTMAVNRNDNIGKVWAVVVGVDTYTNLPHLKYAVKDAKAFNDLLLDNNLVSSKNIFLVTDKQANIANLRTVLGTKLKQKAGKDDLVIIYFAGHGATERDSRSPDGDGLEKYLLPYDSDPENLYATALPMREISHILDRISSERLVFIADACYSGASGGRTVARQGIRANLSDDFIDRISSGKGRVIMTASGANEVSVEDDELEHGVFTYYLLEAMKGKADYDSDGLVTVDEGYRYVSEEVPRATGQEQHPVKKGAVQGQLILGVVD